MKAADILIFLLFIMIIILSSTFLIKGGDEVLIYADGIEYRYPISEERIVEVEGPLGITAISIKDGDAEIISSPCPNKTCLNTRMGNSICCLPNHVLVTIGKMDDGVDAYAY